MVIWLENKKSLDWNNVYNSSLLDGLRFLKQEFIIWNQERFSWHPALLRVTDSNERNNGTAFLYEYRGIRWVLLTAHQTANNLSNSPKLIFSTQDWDSLLNAPIVRLSSSINSEDVAIAILDDYPKGLGSIKWYQTHSPLVHTYGYPLHTKWLTKYDFLNVSPWDKPIKSSWVIKKNIWATSKWYDELHIDFSNIGSSWWPILSYDWKKLVGMMHGWYFDNYWRFSWTASFVPVRKINQLIDNFIEFLEKNQRKLVNQISTYDYAKNYAKFHQEYEESKKEVFEVNWKILDAYNNWDYMKINQIIIWLLGSNKLGVIHGVFDRFAFIVLSSASASWNKVLFNKLINLLQVAELYAFGTDSAIRSTYERYKYLWEKYWKDLESVTHASFQERKMNMPNGKSFYIEKMSKELKEDKIGMWYINLLLP